MGERAALRVLGGRGEGDGGLFGNREIGPGVERGGVVVGVDEDDNGVGDGVLAV